MKKRDDFCSVVGLVLVALLFMLVAHLEAVWSDETPTCTQTYTNLHQLTRKQSDEKVEVESVEIPEYISLGTFETTGYCPCEKCCDEWADGYTATGTVATAGRTVAVDPDVIPYGTKLMVLFDDGRIEHYIAEDCGGTIKGNKLDVFYATHEDALKHGVQNASVYIEE